MGVSEKRLLMKNLGLGQRKKQGAGENYVI
jgi:hypothetical protein